VPAPTFDKHGETVPPAYPDPMLEPAPTPGGPLPAGPIPGVTPAPLAPGPAAPSASDQAYGPAKAGPRPMLAQGSNGPSVMDLQARLDRLGESLAVDGLFGPLTRAAVVRFQTSRGLSPDGIVGPLTWAALDTATAPATTAEPDTDPDTIDTDDTDGPLLHKPGATEPSSTTPALDDLGGNGDNVAIGDAEGNGNEPGSSIGPLETLDRDGDTTTTDTGLGAGNLLGFGEKTPRPPPVAHPQKAALLAGDFADKGAYKLTGDGFTDTELDELLAAYGTFWGVDVRATPSPDDTDVTKPGAGDSAGKGVATHPPWVKALQNKIIGRAKWDDDDRATQRLLEAFNRRFARDAGGELPPGVEQLFHQIGAGETNGQASSLAGYKGASNWCAPASHIGLILGMYNRGIRFKTTTHSTKYGEELTKQVTQYSKWTKQGGHVVGGKDAWGAQLEPGDIITVVNGGPMGPLSGHVATVVQHTADRIVYVSGNAAGVVAFEGAVRIEEVNRERPQNEDYDWLAMSANEKKFQTADQDEKKNTKEAAAERTEAFGHLNKILHSIPAETTPPPWVDLNDSTSIASLMVWLAQLPPSDEKQEALGHAVAILRLNHAATKHEDAATKAAATKAGMMSDPKGLPVNRADKRFVPGLHAPKDGGTSWVVEVIKASALTQAAVLADKSVSVEPTDPMLEKGPRLVEQCPDAPAEVVNRSAK
jgi:peptidoglycan hydrolase-like protein with peptidoglycan-binding domain